MLLLLFLVVFLHARSFSLSLNQLISLSTKLFHFCFPCFLFSSYGCARLYAVFAQFTEIVDHFSIICMSDAGSLKTNDIDLFSFVKSLWQQCMFTFYTNYYLYCVKIKCNVSLVISWRVKWRRTNAKVRKWEINEIEWKIECTKIKSNNHKRNRKWNTKLYENQKNPTQIEWRHLSIDKHVIQYTKLRNVDYRIV